MLNKYLNKITYMNGAYNIVQCWHSSENLWEDEAK